MDDGVAGQVRSEMSKHKRENDILGKHIDHTPSQPFVTYTTDPLLGDGEVACPGTTAANSLSENKLSLGLHVAGLAQTRHNAGFVEDRIGCAHTALEIELELLYGQRGRDESQGGVCW